MDISFIIPNFNGEQLLRKNLPRILEIANKYKNGKAEIIVTDDSSRDGSTIFVNDCIQKNKSHVSLILLENFTGKNKGFSTNVNKGVEKASGEIVILLNTDVLPEKNFLNSLLAHFREENVFAVGCMDKSIENGKTVLRGRGIGKWRRGFLVHHAGKINGDTATLWVGGGSGAFRKKMWVHLGGLCQLYNPFYWEDIDISYRAQKAGYVVLFEEKSIVTHEHETGSIKKYYASFNIRSTAYRNQFFFTWLNATDTIILLEHFFFLPAFFLKAILRGDAAFCIGLWNALLLLPKVLSERLKVQKYVVKSDSEVVKTSKDKV